MTRDHPDSSPDHVRNTSTSSSIHDRDRDLGSYRNRTLGANRSYGDVSSTSIDIHRRNDRNDLSYKNNSSYRDMTSHNQTSLPSQREEEMQLDRRAGIAGRSFDDHDLTRDLTRGGLNTTNNHRPSVLERNDRFNNTTSNSNNPTKHISQSDHNDQNTEPPYPYQDAPFDPSSYIVSMNNPTHPTQQQNVYEQRNGFGTQMSYNDDYNLHNRQNNQIFAGTGMMEYRNPTGPSMGFRANDDEGAKDGHMVDQNPIFNQEGYPHNSGFRDGMNSSANPSYFPPNMDTNVNTNMQMHLQYPPGDNPAGMNDDNESMYSFYTYAPSFASYGNESWANDEFETASYIQHKIKDDEKRKEHILRQKKLVVVAILKALSRYGCTTHRIEYLVHKVRIAFYDYSLIFALFISLTVPSICWTSF